MAHSPGGGAGEGEREREKRRGREERRVKEEISMYRNTYVVVYTSNGSHKKSNSSTVLNRPGRTLS